MSGIGRFYSPKCGVIRVGGDRNRCSETKEITIGTTIEYAIDGGSFIGHVHFSSRSEVTAIDIDQAVNSIRDNADSLLQWGLVTPRVGRDNWQRKDNELGLSSKWNPHIYPAIDPELRRKLESEGKV